MTVLDLLNEDKVSDIEYMIHPNFDNKNEIIVSVYSRKHDCSSHMKIENALLLNQGVSLILDVLAALENSLIYSIHTDLLNNKD